MQSSFIKFCMIKWIKMREWFSKCLSLKYNAGLTLEIPLSNLFVQLSRKKSRNQKIRQILEKFGYLIYDSMTKRPIDQTRAMLSGYKCRQLVATPNELLFDRLYKIFLYICKLILNLTLRLYKMC